MAAGHIGRLSGPGAATHCVAVNVIRSLWASVQGNPVVMKRLNGWLTVFFIVLIPVSMWAGWLSSVEFVSALSLWALVSGHWSAYAAARVEVRQDELAQEADEATVQAVKEEVREVNRELRDET